MAFSGKPFFQIPRPIRRKGHLNIETLAGNKTLVHIDSQFQALDPDGSNRDILLPALLDGLRYDILHDGSANDLVIKTALGATSVTLTFGQSATLVCDGVAWKKF